MDSPSLDESEPIPLARATPSPIPLVRAVSRPVRPTIIEPPPDWIEPGTLPRADRVSDRRPPVVRRRRVSVRALMITMGFFAALMSTSFASLGHTLLTAEDTLSKPDDEIRGELIQETMLVEGADTILVLICLALAGLPAARRAAADPLITWLAAGPVLVVLLALNIGYALGLRELFNVDDDVVFIQVDLSTGWIAILLICVQPALVEELFFRYLLLGHLRSHLNLHAAVWISSVIFGMAHLGNIAGWPILILLGAGLGYARVFSGTLALPILLHFLHNFAVLWANDWLFP